MTLLKRSRPSANKPIQREMLAPLAGDPRLLEPGWAGELGIDELEFLQEALARDKKLAHKWGFRPGAKRRPEWAIRQVAMWGNPESRKTNMELARQQQYGPRPSPIT